MFVVRVVAEGDDIVVVAVVVVVSVTDSVRCR